MSYVVLTGVVEDEWELTQTLVTTCEAICVQAASAREALVHLHLRPVAVLVARHQPHLPDFDALELFARARAIRPMLRGILISDDPEVAVARQAFELGCDDCLRTEDCEAGELIEAIFESLERHDRWCHRFTGCHDFNTRHLNEFIDGPAHSTSEQDRRRA